MFVVNACGELKITKRCAFLKLACWGSTYWASAWISLNVYKLIIRLIRDPKNQIWMGT